MPESTNKIPASLPRVHRAIAAWYARHGRRSLPWRNTRDPYHVYVSEIMLQQTQVKTVLDRYYAPFLKRFPTLHALARADRETVMKQWEGLGYYTRAANLHAAAQHLISSSPLMGEVAEQSEAGGGDKKINMPAEVEALRALPGIGRNTAHAVACFGFGASVPIMEANVKRVLCRVFAMKEPDTETLWQKAWKLLDKKRPFDYNQAMMDIGAMICTPRAPRCGECPLAIICRGKTSPESYPAPKATKTVPVRKRIIIVFTDGCRRYYLARRDTRFLGGLYGFMEVEAGQEDIEFEDRKIPLKSMRLLGALSQTYSHFILEAKVYLSVLPALPKDAFTLKEIMRLPLSKADRKIVRMLEEL